MESHGERALQTSHGVAFAVSEHLMVSCAHLVGEKGEEVFVRTKDGWMECSVEAIDKHLDVCLLRVNGEKLDIPEVDTDENTSGWGIIFGCNFGDKKEQFSVQFTKDTNGEDHLVGECSEFTHGSSGSPVTRRKKIVGMACGIVEKETSGKIYYLPYKTIAAWVAKVLKEKK